MAKAAEAAAEAAAAEADTANADPAADAEVEGAAASPSHQHNLSQNRTQIGHAVDGAQSGLVQRTKRSQNASDFTTEVSTCEPTQHSETHGRTD